MAVALSAAPARFVLSDDLIDACGSRAAAYDRENRFFTEDFRQLREAGYLNMLVPKDLGGLELSLLEVCKERERLRTLASLGAEFLFQVIGDRARPAGPECP